jgi:hypothetical protein
MSIRVVNIIPQTLSAETFFDSEPSIAVDPANTERIVITAFTPVAGSPGPVTTGLYFWSNDGGFGWAQAQVIPGGTAALPFGDASVRFGGSSGVLYAAIIRVDTGNLNILRKPNFTGPGLMTILVNRGGPDQPWVETSWTKLPSGTVVDRVYVSSNDTNRATVEFSLDAASAAPPAGFIAPFIVDSRPGSNRPAVRTAIHSSGRIYGILVGVRPGGSDIVVIRDDNWGSGNFNSLVDPGDSLPGRRVATGVSVPPVGTLLGTERISSRLSIAVDPHDSRRVYIVWGDGLATAASPFTLRVRRSSDGGLTWTGDLFTVTNATNPALAVNSAGTVALLYQEFVNVSGVNRWKTHLALSTNHFTSVAEDIILANVLDSNAGITHLVSIGDYLDMKAVELGFYGVFSAFNVPDLANFPSGVTYLRNANFTTKTLLDPTGVTTVSPSVDPFFFRYWPPDTAFYPDIMSFFQNFSNKNFELVVREENHLQHYNNDFGVGGTAWNAGASFGSNINPASAPVMFQNFSNKNFELVVREGNNLRHYYNDFGVGGTAWNAGAAFGSNIASTPAMFQNSENKNFELVVREGNNLRHYYNDFGVGGTAWNAGAAFGSNITSNPVMFQNFSNKNFELVVREFDGLLWHYWNDFGGGTNAWNRGTAVYD